VPETGDLGARLRVLARRAAGTGPVKQQLVQLQDFLRDTLDYSLVTLNSQDLDPIENFLFEEKRGHCEYFATAGALMARALGLPSRVAYGWAGGTWYDDSGLFVFRANEAHAWTEVWLENHGWVLMDPTPQSARAGERARVAPPGESLSETLADEETTVPPEAADLGGTLTRVGLSLMLVFGVPAGLLAVMRGKRRPAEETRADLPGAAAPGYFKLWRQACAARGIAMPPGTTLRRQLSRVPEPPEFAAELLAYHYGTRYEGRPPDARAEKSLARRIRHWEAGISGINDGSGPSQPSP
jgi:hypothetical protein